MPKFRFEEAVWGRRTIEVRAANLEEAEKVLSKHGADGKSRDCRVVETKYYDAFLTEVSDEQGKVLQDYLPAAEVTGEDPLMALVKNHTESETEDGIVR